MTFDFTPYSFSSATPESVGVDSRAVTAFISRLRAENLGVQGFMYCRRGKVVSRMIAPPYSETSKRHVYSISKSWVGTAIGIARDENLLSLSDRIVDIFPDKLPEKVSPNLAHMTIHDLLCMTCGHDGCPSGEMVMSVDGDWVRTFLAHPVPYTPGRRFAYNSGGSYMLSAVITKLTGKPVIDYLTPRLFNPLGIRDVYWDSCPRGINEGGWGIHVSMEDMLKLGVLYLNGGSWEGKQVISRDWARLASSYKSDNSVTGTLDWGNGYGYQMWRCQHNCFRGDGAYGQLMIISPDDDSVLALISEENRFQQMCDAYWETIVASVTPRTPYRMEAFYTEDASSLPENPVALAALRDAEKSWTNAPLYGGGEAKDFSGAFSVSGSSSVRRVKIETRGGEAAFLLTFADGSVARVKAGSGRWIANRFEHFPACITEMMVNPSVMRRAEPAVSFKWDGGVLDVSAQFVDSPHALTFTVDLTSGEVVKRSGCYPYGEEKFSIKGE